MTFGPSARVTIDGAPRGTQPCAIPTPIGVLLPIATATTPSSSARRPANRARAGPPAAPPASGIAPPATAYAPATISAWSPACESTNSSTIRCKAPSTVATAFAVASRPAARVDQAVRADGGRSRHAGDGGAARGLPSLGGDGVGIRVGGREDEHQPGLAPELGDRAFHGVGAGPWACSRRRAGHAFADVGCGCWGHAAGSETTGYRNYRRFRVLRNQRAAYAVTSVCGPDAS